MRKVARGNPGPVVRHRDEGMRGGRPDGHMHGVTGSAVAARVAEQVADGLVEPVDVTDHLDGRWAGHRHRDSPARERRTRDRDRLRIFWIRRWQSPGSAHFD